MEGRARHDRKAGSDKPRPPWIWPSRVTSSAAIVLLALLATGCGRADEPAAKPEARPAAYDPLAVPTDSKVEVIDLTVSDTARNREIPIRVYLPATREPAPVVLFSHGLGGSREGSPFLGKHWAGRGYVAVFLQHPGSDTSVWKDQPAAQRMTAMKQSIAGADGAKNFLLRVKDVPAVLDQLGRWQGEDGHHLSGRVDLAQVGMSGHSFGAVTTQAVSGQAIMGRTPFTDPRIKAAIVMSQSSPRRGTPEAAFGQVDLPWLLMTGTKDTAIVSDTDMASRLAVFPALPPGAKYELVLFEAEHSAFVERALPGESGKRNPNHHQVILALSTAFLDAYVRNDRAALAWLDGDGPTGVLEPQDQWQKK